MIYFLWLYEFLLHRMEKPLWRILNSFEQQYQNIKSNASSNFHNSYNINIIFTIQTTNFFYNANYFYSQPFYNQIVPSDHIFYFNQYPYQNQLIPQQLHFGYPNIINYLNQGNVSVFPTSSQAKKSSKEKNRIKKHLKSKQLNSKKVLNYKVFWI